MIANPYAIRYATEARMYSLEMLLVASGHRRVPAGDGETDDRPPRSGRVARRAVRLHAVLVVLSPRRRGRACSCGRRGAASRRVAARRVLVAMVDRRSRVPAVAADVPVPARPHRNSVGHRRSCRRSRSATRCATSRAARAERRPIAKRVGCSSSSCCRCSSWACSAGAIDERRIEIDLHVPRETRVDRVSRRARADRRVDAELSRRRRVPVAVQRDRVPVLRPARGPRIHDPARPAHPRRSARRSPSCSASRGACATSLTQRTQAPQVAAVLRQRSQARRPRRVLPRPGRARGASARAARARRGRLPELRRARTHRLGRLQEAPRRGQARRVRPGRARPGRGRTRSGT